MKFVLPVLSFLAIAYANPDYGQWEAPRAGDSRSPCPALNAMANHKFIPQDGRGLTTPILIKGLGKGLNISAEVVAKLSLIGIATSKNPASGSFDLSDLSAHNKVEHDGSLSRCDFDMGGDATRFSPETFNETLSFLKGAEEVGISEVAAARWGRLQSSKAHNPKFTYGEGQYFPSYFESAAYYQLFKDPKTNKASVDWIKVFFSELDSGVVGCAKLTVLQARTACLSRRAGVRLTASMALRLRRMSCCLR